MSNAYVSSVLPGVHSVPATPPEDVTAPGDVARSSSTLRPKEKRTLWIGDLDRAEGPVDDIYVKSHMFYEFSGCITAVRICRDRVSRQPSFGFVEFVSQSQAQYVLEHMNGRLVPGRMHKYRLNWANFNLTETPEPRTVYSRPAQLNRLAQENPLEGASNDPGRRLGAAASRGQACAPSEGSSVWVGSLDPATCREEVEELFHQHYNSVSLVKLIMDPNTGRTSTKIIIAAGIAGSCKGFGFVHFSDPEEAERSLEEMNGAICHGRRIKVNRSNSSRGGGGPYGVGAPPFQAAMQKIYSATSAEAQRLATEYCGGFVPTKRKRGVLTGGDTARILVRGLDPTCTEEELTRHFSPFGEVLLARVSQGGKGYVTFAEGLAATHALQCMEGAAYMYYYQQYAAACPDGVARGALGMNGAKSRARRISASEEEICGGLFRDTDPSLVPPEFLPRCMFTLEATGSLGSSERHAFLWSLPCQQQVGDAEPEKFQAAAVHEEYGAARAAIEGALRKRMRVKVDRGIPLEPDDLERLYSTDLQESAIICC
ncbi:RNA recognition motif-containing protein [Cyclospora cayetanensis]|uniref:RNA recognition motif-containing protein n=1 Tax=Cyclospora cayetanensis TaxID=88456 RepID=A0A1D3CU12_9EIME|nr:RNA recognition motif-containing protein [Cyclospora cayetanensis]